MGREMLSSSKYIKTVPFNSLVNWSVQYLDETRIAFNTTYPLVRIGNFLKRNKTAIQIKDNATYKRATIKVRNGGIFLRDEKIGAEIGTKNQFIISEGQFLLSKIDARNGAFGVVPKELDGGIITGNFWTFDVDFSKVNPFYLSLLVTTSEFIQLCEQASNGTTNRHYLQESIFLDMKIPLPHLDDQNALVASYNGCIAIAEAQETQAHDIEQQIGTYLLDKLGIKINDRVIDNSVLQYVQFSDITDRWDLLATQNTISGALKNSIFPVFELGQAYEFVSRSWKPDMDSDRTFRYVELGAIDEFSGIIKAIVLPERKAPSRATQTIKNGDLIIGTTRPYLKKFALVNSEYDGCICSSGFQIINFSTNSLEFLYEYLKSLAGIMQFKLYMTGALYPAITTKDLRKIKIPIPPRDIQDEIVTHIAQLKEQIKLLRAQATINRIAALTEFRKKIFQ